MKIYFFLFSFAFINIMAVTKEDCKKAAVITNELLMQVCIEGDFQSFITRILHGEYTMEKLAYMVSAPELAATDECLKCEQDMQKDILETISSIKMPDSRTLNIKEAYIEGVGFMRRTIVQPFLKRLIIAVNGNEEKNLSDLQVCLLIGLYKNSFFLIMSSEFIKTAKINDSDRCELVSADGDTTYYERFDNVLCQVWTDNSNKSPIISSSE